MMLVLRSLFASLSQVYTHVSITLVSSLVALATFLPFMLLVAVFTLFIHSYAAIPISILIFLGVLPYPGCASAQVIARELATGDLVVTSDAWTGLQEHWRFALRAWIVGAVVTIGLLGNLTFYTHLALTPGSLSVPGYVLAIFFLAVLSIWLVLQFHVYPLLLIMERQDLRLVYRNALVLVGMHPVASVLGTAVWVGWLMLCAATGVFFAGGFLVAATIQQNIFTRLPAVRRAPAGTAIDG